MTCDRAVSKESRACIEMMKNAHLVLFGTEDGGEIVSHGERDVMNALGCDESELRRVFNLELVVGLSGRCARVATLLSAVDSSGNRDCPFSASTFSHMWLPAASSLVVRTSTTSLLYVLASTSVVLEMHHGNIMTINLDACEHSQTMSARNSLETPWRGLRLSL